MEDLGGDDDVIPTGKIAQGAADNLFAAAVGVAVGGIEEVNAAVDGAFDDRTAALFRQRPGVVPRSGSPKVMHPRHSRETLRSVFLMYCIAWFHSC
jgi:hypothetical protein